MSASSIPNLLSLRGGPRGNRVRGRGRGGHNSGPAHGRDAIIQGTDTDAAVSRLSAVELGYLHDPFAQHFVPRGSAPVPRRLPIINRGTYTRTAALDHLVDTFLSLDEAGPSGEKQIISLGAGTDTRSFRLFSRQACPVVTYHEVDFPAICRQKLKTVLASPQLRQTLPAPTEEDGGCSWRAESPNGSQLWCHGIDLRDLAVSNDASSLEGLKADVPTLLISECCLCYLQSSEAGGVVKWFTDRIPDLGLVIYEPVKPDDPFGRMMVSNLAVRGIRMPTLEIYKEPQDQESRLKEAGFGHVKQMTVDQIWGSWISDKEKERVDSLEGLDEVEEWKLLAGHYIVAWAWRGLGFESWRR